MLWRRPLNGVWILALALPRLCAGTEPCLERASPAESQQAFALYRQGQEALESGQLAEAETLFLASTQLDPSLPLGHYGLGELYMTLKRFPEAVAAFTACKQAFECLGLSLGERVQLRRLLEDATHELRDAVRRVEQERLARGLILWQEVNRSSPPGMGQSSLYVQQLEKRLMQLEEWKRRVSTPQLPSQVAMALGSAHFHLGSLAEAEREFREALELDPRLGDAHNNLAVVYMLMGRLDEAQAEMKLAEKGGASVSPRLKEEIEKRKSQAR
jgi:tetratricopeptide (TPR) repeat protein